MMLNVIADEFAGLESSDLHHATLGCLELGSYQQFNLSCSNNSLIYVIDVRHSHSNQSQAAADPVTCSSDTTSSVGDESWCVDGPPYDEMVIIQCNSRTNCSVDTAEMSSAMYTCHDYVTDVIQANYLCLPGETITQCSCNILALLCLFYWFLSWWLLLCY